MEGKLLLIDGFALIYRAWYAIPSQMKARDGLTVNAVYGFAQMLLGVLDREKPSHMAIAFEGEGPTYRHKEYPEYKATRPSMPEDLRNQLSIIRTLAAVLGIPVYSQAGAEADDVIATLTTQAVNLGLETHIVTGDKDLLALVNDKNRVAVLMPQHGAKFSEMRLMDVTACKEKYGFDPYFFPSFKAFTGDKSDNLPGVPSIGEKTAISLITQWGTAGNILFHLAEVKPQRIQELIRERREQLFQTLRLVALVNDLAEIKLDLEATRLGQWDTNRALELFEGLGFNSIRGKLAGVLRSQGHDQVPAAALEKSPIAFQLDQDQNQNQDLVIAPPPPVVKERTFKATREGQLLMF